MPVETSTLRFSLADLPVPMVFATHRIIRDCNEEFLALFGYAREELVNKSFARLYPKHDDFIRTGLMWSAHLPEGRVYYDERIMTNGSGHSFWCQVHGRSRNLADPFAEALYCFQPIARSVSGERLQLTDRQRQILALVAQGKTNAVIAEELALSVRTVESHRARVMKAAGIKNAAELIARFNSL
ncbi:PAS domain S-box protein [Agrobacterium larrymoorei]|uniref:LuxR C-terminal-related transcriptional regulator n=1 Tax=Agrobacterium larrymoorei TaxID=160699 RepID=UPI0015719885|nr:LuxR C-terminal-related transcriptional regulator [Agrobacterium larrymoorei]NTJ44305.1 PAS domain S-box protein [Agrobacterium larrymoorei]